MELIASHAALSLASNYRADYLRNFFELGKANLSSAKEGEAIAYVIPAGQGRDENVAKIIGALVEQGLDVYRLDKELHAKTGIQNITRIANTTTREPVKTLVWGMSSGTAMTANMSTPSVT